MIVEQGDSASVFARPRRADSVGFLSSVLLPNPWLRFETDIRLMGEIPSPINLPKGCFLASRCPFAIDQCRAEIPRGENVGGDHVVHCIRHEDVSKAERTAGTFQEFQLDAERILSVGASNRSSANAGEHLP